jgi:hypothetical protein
MNVYAKATALIESLPVHTTIRVAMLNRLRWSTHALLSLSLLRRDNNSVTMTDWSRTTWFRMHVKPMDMAVLQVLIKIDLSDLGSLNELIAELSDITAEMLEKARKGVV